MKLQLTILFIIFFIISGRVFPQHDTTAISTDIQVKSKKRDGVKTSTIILPVDSNIKKQEAVPLTDSILRKKHNPTTATLLSIIPGGGQIYNRKWWKVPIIYACLGVSGYFIYDFAGKTTLYQKEYIYRMNGEISKLNPNLASYADENVLALKNYYRRNLEIAIGAMTVVYLLNLIDATVDAHLFYFDISDDLSLHIKPFFNNNYDTNSFSSGLAFSIKF